MEDIHSLLLTLKHSLGSLFTTSFWMGLLIQYKYWVVIAGALIEGEIILMLAGGAAYHGHLSLPMVAAIAFIGAFIHDYLLFFLGRKVGSRLINRFALLRKKSPRVLELIHQYDRWFILSFRFIYGVRTVTPIIVGTSSIPVKRYSLLVVTSALVWAVLISYLGYTFALALEALIENFSKYSKYLAAGVILVVIGIYGAVQYAKKKKGKR